MVAKRAKSNSFKPKGKSRFTQPEDVTPEQATALAKKRFTTHDMCAFRAKNERQQELVDKYNSGVKMLIADGPAGTGKTFLAMYCAFLDVLDEETPFEKVVIIRTAVEGRTQGHLPGEQEDKNAPFEEPYIDACSIIFKGLGGYSAYGNLKALKKLEFRTTSHLRGVNLRDSVVIFDEAQNGDIDEISTIIERCNGSRVIILGCAKQNDLKRKRQESGFQELLKTVEDMRPGFHEYVKFEIDDVVRDGLVKEWLRARHKRS